MAVLVERVQVFKPDTDNDIFARAVYACHLPLEKLQEAGAVLTISMTDPTLLLGAREMMRNAKIYVKTAPDGTGLSRLSVDMGTAEGGTLNVFQNFLDVSVNTAGDGNLLSSAGTFTTSSTNNFVTNGTLGTLLDSVSGNCTPQAITALIATSYSRVTTVNYNGITTRTDLTDDAGADLTIKLTAVGCNLEDLAAGDLWIYFETETLPTFCV